MSLQEKTDSSGCRKTCCCKDTKPSYFKPEKQNGLQIQKVLNHCNVKEVAVTLSPVVPPMQPIEYLNTNISYKGCGHRQLLLLLINSRPSHRQRRINIRRTWGNNTVINRLVGGGTNAWLLLFVIGKSEDRTIEESVRIEASYYQDILAGTFIDNYPNLTIKTVFGMQWAYHYCRPYYFFKGDDDIFLNAPRMLDYIGHQILDNSINFWVGRVNKQRGQLVVVRKKGHKYYVPHNDYDKRFFPQFCSGFAYVMSGDVVAKIIKEQPTVKMLKGVDDAYIGIVAEKVQVKPVHNHRFHVFYPSRTNFSYTAPIINMLLAEHNIVHWWQLKRLCDIAWEEYWRRSAYSPDKLVFKFVTK